MADAYLDTSALVKRYIEEPGTPAVDTLFDRAFDGSIIIATSAWNVGEAFGVFDHRRMRKLLTEAQFRTVAQSLSSEFARLMELNALQVFPVRASMLIDAWPLVLSKHLYQADALQIVTCNNSQSKVLVTSDQFLRRASEEVGLKALDPQKNEQDLRDMFG